MQKRSLFSSSSTCDSSKRRSFLNWILNSSTNRSTSPSESSTKLEINNTIRHSTNNNRISPDKNKQQQYTSKTSRIYEKDEFSIRHCEKPTNTHDSWKPLPRIDQSSNKQFVSDIPTRRTSRNYYNNPEVEAKLNALLNSDRANHLSQLIHQKRNQQL